MGSMVVKFRVQQMVLEKTSKPRFMAAQSVDINVDNCLAAIANSVQD